MKHDFTSNLQNEIKDFQTTLMSSVEKMITKKMEVLIIAMQQSFQATVAQAIAQSLQNNHTMESMHITQLAYNSHTSNSDISNSNVSTLSMPIDTLNKTNKIT